MTSPSLPFSRGVVQEAQDDIFEPVPPFLFREKLFRPFAFFFQEGAESLTPFSLDWPRALQDPLKLCRWKEKGNLFFRRYDGPDDHGSWNQMVDHFMENSRQYDPQTCLSLLQDLAFLILYQTKDQAHAILEGSLVDEVEKVERLAHVLTCCFPDPVDVFLLFCQFGRESVHSVAVQERIKALCEHFLPQFSSVLLPDKRAFGSNWVYTYVQERSHLTTYALSCRPLPTCSDEGPSIDSLK